MNDRESMANRHAAASADVAMSAREFELLRKLVYDETGIHLRESKQVMLAARLHKRLRHLGLSSFAAYYKFLQNEDREGAERLQMINCVTTNKTDFFRESHHFEYLKEHVFPELERQKNKSGQRKIRIWSAACSSGEEPYSLAAVVMEYFGNYPDWDIRILASDIDTDVLNRAGQGVYGEERCEMLSTSRKNQMFDVAKTATGGREYHVKAGLKNLVAFRRINFQDRTWPIHTSFDVIFCRNVLIYFDEATQDRLLSRFAEFLTPDGLLFIGHSESIIRLAHLFEPRGNTIYAKCQRSGHAEANGDKKTPPSAHHEGVGNSPEEGRRGSTRRAKLVLPAKSEASKESLVRIAGQQKEPSAPQRDGAEEAGSEATLIERSVIVGEVLASDRPMRISTLVGSCIAVCLFDPVVGVGGLNHFMLPGESADQRISAAYGMHAMDLLINEMMRHGANRYRLQAKLFGGANVVTSLTAASSIGDRNIEFALNYLATEGFPVVASHVGGTRGRVIKMYTHTGRVLMRFTREMIPPPETGVQLIPARVAGVAVNADKAAEVTLF